MARIIHVKNQKRTSNVCPTLSVLEFSQGISGSIWTWKDEEGFDSGNCKVRRNRRSGNLWKHLVKDEEGFDSVTDGRKEGSTDEFRESLEASQRKN